MKDNVADKILRLMNTMRQARLEYLEVFWFAVPVRFKHLVFVWCIYHAKLLYIFHRECMETSLRCEHQRDKVRSPHNKGVHYYTDRNCMKCTSFGSKWAVSNRGVCQERWFHYTVVKPALSETLLYTVCWLSSLLFTDGSPLLSFWYVSVFWNDFPFSGKTRWGIL